MKTVAIIAEYNPFHNGHKYQIDKIREEFGENTQIIAIMSGNYTQRGGAAFMEKWERARVAVECGINLVLELPFPYSMSSAELFAKAAVGIINSLGVVDILSFGSECGDIETLVSAAKNTLKPEYNTELKRILQSDEHKSLGYAAASELAYKNAFNTAPPEQLSNNILALEYIKAVIESDSSLEFHTTKRLGGAYNEDKVTDSELQSATAIRALINKNDFSAYKYIPERCASIISEQIKLMACPTDESRLDSAVISHLRLNPQNTEKPIHDTQGGLYNRLIKESHQASTISSLQDLTVTKKYTIARIRRAIWYTFFGVTSSNVKSAPQFTQILAMDKIGQALLKKIKKTAKISILTKPSSMPESPCAAEQKQLSDKADAVFQLMKPCPKPATDLYKRGPFIKEK